MGRGTSESRERHSIKLSWTGLELTQEDDNRRITRTGIMKGLEWGLCAISGFGLVLFLCQLSAREMGYLWRVRMTNC